MILFAIISTILKRNENRYNYVAETLFLIMLMLISTKEIVTISTIIISEVLSIFTLLFKLKKEDKNMPIIFYLSFTNIILLIIANFI